MTTLKAQIASDVSAVFLNEEEHADSVTRYPLGDTAAGEPVTAIWEEDDPQQLLKSGKESERMGTLSIAEDQTADDRDRWLINSEIWDAVTVGRIEEGMKTVRVKRIVEEYRKPRRP